MRVREYETELNIQYCETFAYVTWAMGLRAGVAAQHALKLTTYSLNVCHLGFQVSLET